jgi:hypothetical protein
MNSSGPTRIDSFASCYPSAAPSSGLSGESTRLPWTTLGFNQALQQIVGSIHWIDRQLTTFESIIGCKMRGW